ncbi:beta-lactamase [Aureococcus anophagefferens]|nr:beta-lactamase [Aureococcus anophagefferens]
MHYVPGVPRSAPFPDALALVSGSDAAPAPHGYASLDVDRAPGTRFAYSGGGFLVLQHLLEAASGAPAAESLDGWLAAGGGAVDAAAPGGVPGLDWSRVPDLADGFDYAGLRQEEIVNLGLRDLVLNAFVDP